VHLIQGKKKNINIILQNKLYHTFEKTCEYTTYNNLNLNLKFNNSLKKSLKKQPNQKKL
jgi:hypothetical protein